MFYLRKGGEVGLLGNRNKTMTNEAHTPTFDELYAYEAKARVLRAQAMRDGISATSDFLKSLVSRMADAFLRPAQA